MKAQCLDVINILPIFLNIIREFFSFVQVKNHGIPLYKTCCRCKYIYVYIYMLIPLHNPQLYHQVLLTFSFSLIAQSNFILQRSNLSLFTLGEKLTHFKVQNLLRSLAGGSGFAGPNVEGPPVAVRASELLSAVQTMGASSDPWKTT